MLNAIAPIATVLNVTHKDCFDGLVSAWIVRKWATKNAYAYETHYANYQDKLPDIEMFRGKIVVITDFSYPVDYMVKMSRVAREIYAFDHHESAELNFEGFDLGQCDCPMTVKFDKDHSGAGLTWNHLYKGHEMPWVVKNAQDHDLWRFEYTSTQPIMAYLGMLGLSLGSVSIIDENYDKAVHLGQLLVEKDERMVDWHLQNVDYFSVHPEIGLIIPIVNAPRYIASKVADRLTTEYPFVIMYEDYPDYRKGSIRTNGKHGVKANEIASLFDGAGNPKAAGCSFSKSIDMRQQLMMKPGFLSRATPKVNV